MPVKCTTAHSLTKFLEELQSQQLYDDPTRDESLHAMNKFGISLSYKTHGCSSFICVKKRVKSPTVSRL